MSDTETRIESTTFRTDAARRLCEHIAWSSNDRIPAFVFFRPGFAQHRWNGKGSLESFVPTDQNGGTNLLRSFMCLLQLPSATDEPTGVTFPHSALSWYDPTSTFVPMVPEENCTLPISVGDLRFVDELHSQMLSYGIELVFEDGIIYFTLDSKRRETWSRRADLELHVSIGLDFCHLAITSLPEDYSEPLWEFISRHHVDIVFKSVLPFLAANSMSRMNHTKQLTRSFSGSNLRKFGSFAIRHGLGNRCRIRLARHLKPEEQDTWQEQLLIFQDDILARMRNNLTPLPEDLKYQPLFGPPNVILFTLDALMDLQGWLNSKPEHDLIRICLASGEQHSQLETVFAILTSSPKSEATDIEVDIPLQMKAVIGAALKGRERYVEGGRYLVSALEGKSVMYGLGEYIRMSAHLVDCYFKMKLPDRGEEAGRMIFKTIGSDAAAFPYEMSTLKISFSDVLKLGGKYAEAIPVLSSILDAAPETSRSALSPYIKVITSIRLNACDKKLGFLCPGSLMSDGLLSKALPDAVRCERNVKLRYVEEVLDSVAQLYQDGYRDILRNSPVKAFLRDVLTLSNREDTSLAQDWRFERIFRMAQD